MYSAPPPFSKFLDPPLLASNDNIIFNTAVSFRNVKTQPRNECVSSVRRSFPPDIMFSSFRKRDGTVIIRSTRAHTIDVYAAETWPILDADIKPMEAFHFRCQRRCYVWIRRQARVRNADISLRTGLCIKTLCDSKVKLFYSAPES